MDDESWHLLSSSHSRLYLLQVLEQGRVAEFDQPKRLLANPASHFSRLLAESASASEHVGSAPAAHA